MFSRTRHTILIGRIVLLLFVFSSSGFTMIIQKCSMTENASCCSAASTKSLCEKNTSSHVPTLKRNVLPCMITTLAGKLSPLQALSEQSEMKEPLFISIYSLTSAISLPCIENSATSFLTNSQAYPVCSVEKCILFSTYLI